VNTVTKKYLYFDKIRGLLRIFCLLLFTTTKVFSQTVSLTDSLKKHFHSPSNFTGKWDTQNSFITGKSIQIQSLKMGLIFNQSITVGLGFHWINSKNFQDYVLDGFKDSSPIRMHYFSIFTEYVFFKRNNWMGIIPVQLGIGKSFLRKGEDRIFERMVCLYEPSISIEYKFSPWLALGAGYGYRIMLKNNRLIDQNFYAPIYVFRARILFDEIYSRYILAWREQRD
jgi:hypothetical protein